MLTVRQAAAALNVSPATVRRLVRSGLLDAIDVRTPGSSRACLRISQKALDAFIASAATNTPATVSKPQGVYFKRGPGRGRARRGDAKRLR